MSSENRQDDAVGSWPSTAYDDKQRLVIKPQTRGGPCQLSKPTRHKHHATALGNRLIGQPPRAASAYGGPENKRPSSAGLVMTGGVQQDATAVNTVARPVNHSTLARLKAEVAELAAHQNVQLQSLRPLCNDNAAVLATNSNAKSSLQVLDQTDLLPQLALTYTEARKQSSNSADKAEPNVQQVHLEVHERNSSVQRSPSVKRPGEIVVPSVARSASADISALMAEIQGGSSYSAEAAKAELQCMRQWVAEQDVRLLEPGVAALFSNKTVAARISQLQSEHKVLQYQRQYYEAALAQLRSDRFYGRYAPWRQKAEYPDPKDTVQSGEASESPYSMQHPQDINTAHLNGPLALEGVHDTARHSDGTAVDSNGLLSFSLTGADSCHTSASTSTSSSQVGDSCAQGHQCSSAAAEGCVQQIPSLHHCCDRQQIGALKQTAITAEEQAEESGLRVISGYSGSASNPALQRCVSPDNDVLQLSHCGLRPQQLDKVAAALDAAPWVTVLDLSGNLLTDRGIIDLVKLLTSTPRAASLAHVNLSQNQLLTWRCCSALSLLMHQPQGGLHPVTTSCKSTLRSFASGQLEALSHSSQGCMVINDSATLNNPHRYFLEAPESSRPSSAVNSRVCYQPNGNHCLNLRSLSLEGVAIGDKGAVQLAAGLSAAQCMQVLCLAHCGLHDSGGAAICSTVRQHASIVDLDISWNALAHCTARAVEAAFRCPNCHLACLRMSHCGLDDRDGARILDALTPANSYTAYSSSCGSSTASNACNPPSAEISHKWRLLDLSYNSLEGGAAVCAAAVITAFTTCTGTDVQGYDTQQQQYPKQLGNSRVTSAGASRQRTNTGHLMPSSDGQLIQNRRRELMLDGNPLGVAGVRCIARAMAGQSSIGVLQCLNGSTSCAKCQVPRDSVALLDVCPAPCEPTAVSASDDIIDLKAEPSLALSVNLEAPLTPKGAGTLYSPGQQQQKKSESEEQIFQQQQRPALHVSIAKVTLVAKEKGVRSSLRDTHASGAANSQVATLLDALKITEKPKLVGVNSSSTSGSRDSTGSSSSSSSKSTGVKGSLPLVSSGPPDADSLVITEAAAGFDLTCPAGRYRLQLRHPAVRHLVHQLLQQRIQLQLFQQQVKELQLQQSQNQQQLELTSDNTRPSTPPADLLQPEEAMEAAANITPSSSRSTRTPGTTTSKTTGSGATAAASRAATATGARSPASSPGTTAASRPTSTAGGTRQAKRKVLSCPVSILALQDVKLDSKSVRVEQLLELQPWYRPPAPGFTSENGGSNAADSIDVVDATADRGAAGRSATADAAAGPIMSAAGGVDVRKPGRIRKSYKQLEFTVKAAAVLTGHDAPVMPAQLLQWVLKVMADPAASDVWKLQLLELLLPDWLLTPQQAAELLSMFDKDLGQEEKLSAAGLMWARLVQPMDFWDQVSPAALKPMQQQQFQSMLGPTLMTLDRQNLTGSYVLNLNWAVHRAVARRLQVTALQENSTSECRYYLCWRNATLNGVSIPEVAIAQLQEFAIPSNGSLKLDYVSYQVPLLGSLPACPSQLRALQAGLRALHNSSQRQLLALREEHLPGGLTRSEEEEKAAAARARLKRPTRFAAGTSKMTDITPQATGNETADVIKQIFINKGGSDTWWESSGLDPSALLLKYSSSIAPASRQTTILGTASSTAYSTGDTSTAAVNSRVRQERASSATGTRRPLSASAAAANKTPGNLKAASKGMPRSSFSAAGSSGGGASNTGSQRVGVTDEELLARLLAASSPQQVAALIPALGEVRAAAVMSLLAAMPSGAAALAALMECLSPLVAARYLHDVPGARGMLPAAVGAKVTPLLKPALGTIIKKVASAAASAAVECCNQQLALIRQFAAQTTGISCNQLVNILQLLKAQGWGHRCAVIVALWAKVVDRNRLVEVFEGLSGSEQLGLMSNLGSYHVWSTLARPDGLHFRLDLTQAEQRDVAREVVKEAVRPSATEREASATRAQHLLNLLAEGKPVLDPEDDKLWLSLESKHTLLEFDFARTWEQELHIMVEAVKRIQRAWRRQSNKHSFASKSAAAEAEAGSSTVPCDSHLSTSAGHKGTGRHPGDRPARSLESITDRMSGFSSELSMGYSSDLTGDNSTLYTGTGGSSMLSTPYSLSALSSEVSLYVATANQQQHVDAHQYLGSMCHAPGAVGKGTHATQAANTASRAACMVDCSKLKGVIEQQSAQGSVAAADCSGTQADSIDLINGSARSFAPTLALPNSSSPTPRLF